MGNINKIATSAFKDIFNAIIDEVELKVRESGFDPKSKEGKGLVSSLYKKVLAKMGIDIEQYNTEEFMLFWKTNKAEFINEIKDEIANSKIFIKKLSDTIENRISIVEKRKINWEEVLNRPQSVFDFEHTDKDHSKIISDIQLLFKNITSNRNGILATVNEKFNNLEIYHKDLKGIGPDDHHKEKHTLESHTDSDLMKQIKKMLDNPQSGKRYMHGGGASAFIQLIDAPTSYVGQAGKALRVNAGMTGLEYYTPAGDTDELVKYDSGDTTAGYLSAKAVAGTGITLSEGTGADENKLKITNSGVITESDPLSWLKATAQTGLTGDKTGSFNLTTTGTGTFGYITTTGIIDASGASAKVRVGTTPNAALTQLVQLTGTSYSSPEASFILRNTSQSAPTFSSAPFYGTIDAQTMGLVAQGDPVDVGGIKIFGVGKATKNYGALYIAGISGMTGTVTSAVVKFDASKYNGSGAWAALSATDLAFSFQSASGTPFTNVYGTGNWDFTSGNLTTAGTGTFGKLVVDSTTLVVNATSYEDRVGIGTATPDEILHLYSSGNCRGIFESGGTGNNAGFIIKNRAGRSGEVQFWNEGVREWSFSGKEDKFIIQSYTDSWIERFKVYDDGRINLPSDNQKLLFGAGQDASIYFDASDLIINSENVTANDEVHFTGFDGLDLGSSWLKTTGTVASAGFLVGATAGIDATVSYTDTVLGAKVLTFVKGILTAQT